MKKLIKKMLILTVIAAMVVTAMPLTGIDLTNIFTIESEAAAAINRAGDYEIYRGSDYVYITKYYGNDIDVVIPSELKGKPVVGIKQDCFSGSTAADATPEQLACAKIKSVTIPGTVERIFSRAFKGCVSLEKINFSEGLYGIDESAFEGCEKLTEINLPQTLDSFNGTALNGTAVEELVLPYYADYISYKQYANTNVKRIIAKGNASVSYLNSTNNVTEEIIVEGFMYARESKNDEGVKNNALKRIVCKSGMEIGAQIEIEAYGLYPHYEDDGTVVFTRTSDEYAENFVSGDYIYTVKNGNEAVITRYIGAGSDITVPYSIDGYTVTEIADYTFTAQWSEVDFRACKTSVIGREQITSITLPATVNKIGAYIFAFNKALKTVNIPEGITEIPYGAFAGAEALESISIASVTKISPLSFYLCISLKNVESSNIKEIGCLAFDSTALTSFDFSDGLKKIGHYAFADCKNLQAAMLPDSLTQLEIGAFSHCNSLETVTLGSVEKIQYECFIGCKIKKLVIPDSVAEIGDDAFNGCNLISLTLSANLKRIGCDAFRGTSDGCVENPNTLTIPDSVEYIDESAFKYSGFGKIIINGTNLEIDANAFSYCKFAELTIGSGVKRIGVCAFSWNRNLVKLEIENGVERIDTRAFSFCNNLQKIEIPESVNCLGEEAFYPCNGVKTIVFNAVDYTCYADYYAPDYLIFDGRNVTELIIGDGVKKIYEGTFCHFEKITELTIPDSVTEIEDFAFYTCPKLEKLILPKNLHTIGDWAFFECLSLKKLVLPESIQSIEFYAFGGGAFTTLTLPEGLQTLSGKAFAGCTSVTEINYCSANCKFTDLTSSNISGLYFSPFYGFSNLKTINLGANIKELPAFLFCGIETISEIVLPSTVTDVGVGAFAFSSITSFKGSENLESIEESAFYGCKSLESADFGNDIMIIGANAFTDCDKLTEIYIPDSVTNIEMEAFKNCPSLKSVRMSPNVDYIPREAFYNCTELSSFTWEADSKLVGRLAFGNCVKLTDFDFLNVEKLYVNSFLGSGVAVVQLGESVNEASPSPLTTIEVQSFKDCENLATLGIGGNVTTVKSQAFADCTNLETAVIADSVTEIAEDAFDGCDKLTIYCSEDSYAHTYAQTQGIKVSTFVIAPIPNQTYTGFEIKPEISVSLSGNNLNRNTDFGIAYANNINVGNADVTVTGKGDFRMYMSKANFTIVTKNIAQATVAPITEQNYTGSPITPAVTITDGGNVLKEGVDYTLTFSGNVDEGTAKVKIKGIGNYSGTAEAEFQIKSQSRIRQIMTALSGFANSIFARLKALITAIFR